jgi:hypothetical protein
MLQLSSLIEHRLFDAVALYELLVASRLGLRKWICGKIQRKAMLPLCSFLNSRDIVEIKRYLLVQFLCLPEDVCYKLFNMPYPPLAALHTKAAEERFLRYESRVPVCDAGLTVEEQKALLRQAGNRDARLLLVTGGLVSEECLRSLSEAEAREAQRLLQKGERNGYL